MQNKIYTGRIRLIDIPGEDEENLCLIEDKNTDSFYNENDTLAAQIERDLQQYGEYLSVKYYISDVSLDEDTLITNWLNQLDGEGEAEFLVRYSDITGYLYTDEELKVGGHDLLQELKSYVGKYLYLSIDYHEEMTKEMLDNL